MPEPHVPAVLVPPKAERLSRRFVREANAHYKDHQGGTLMTLLGIIAGPVIAWLKLDIPAWTAAIWLVMLLCVLASWSAWKAGAKNALILEEKCRPRLKVICEPGIRDCALPVEEGVEEPAKFYRAIVILSGTATIPDFKAHILAIREDGQAVEIAETLQLMISPGVSQRQIDPGPKYHVDIVIIEKAKNAEPRVAFKFRSLQYDRFFTPGKPYEIDVVLSGTGLPSQAFTFAFEYGGEWENSMIRLVREISV